MKCLSDAAGSGGLPREIYLRQTYEWCDLMAGNKWFTLSSNNPMKAELEIIFLNAGSLTVN